MNKMIGGRAAGGRMIAGLVAAVLAFASFDAWRRPMDGRDRRSLEDAAFQRRFAHNPARAELIERDLLALGRSPAELAALPLCSDRPELSCSEDLAGCLYVLEGACLGGRVLIPLLHRRLGLTKDSGAAFFAGDEERTLPRWTVVVAWLDGLPRTGASAEKIVSAAKSTFDAFARWAAVARGGLPWSI